MTDTPNELPDDIYDEITALSEAAKTLEDQGNFDAALHALDKAYQLIPEPKDKWSATFWVMVTMADLYFITSNIEMSFKVLDDLIRFFPEESSDNPFVLMRMGQTLYQMNNEYAAEKFLLNAYQLGGEQVFEGENDVYLNFLIERGK